MATYTNTQKVRSEAWLEGNPYITDPTIDSYIVQANWLIKSRIAARYVLSALDTNFSWSSAEATLDMAEKLLAAWLIMNKEDAGAETINTSDWNAKIQRSDDIISDIVSWDLKLLDSNWDEYDLQYSNSSGGAWLLITESIESTDTTRDFYCWQKF